MTDAATFSALVTNAIDAAAAHLRKQQGILFRDRRPSNELEGDAKRLFQAVSAAGDRCFKRSKELRISYSDFYGDDSEREIRVQSVFRYNNRTYLGAYCFARNDLRTFTLEKIQGCSVDGERTSLPDRAQAMVAEALAIDASLSEIDFFAHPHNWGNHRKPCTYLRRLASVHGLNAQEAFGEVFAFVSANLQLGAWQDFYSDGKAIGMALLSETIDASAMSLEDLLQLCRRGKFSQKAFQAAQDAISNR